jgi:hypothetical protein
MTSLAQRNPQAFGILVTLAGVMIFIPDALIMRLIGGDMLALAFFWAIASLPRKPCLQRGNGLTGKGC